MEFFLVYEFIFHDFDEDRDEGIEFIGLYNDRKTANKVAEERIKYGIEHFNVIINPAITEEKDIFKHTNDVDMYREERYIEAPVYTICIKKLKLEGRK